MNIKEFYKLYYNNTCRDVRTLPAGAEYMKCCHAKEYSKHYMLVNDKPSVYYKFLNTYTKKGFKTWTTVCNYDNYDNYNDSDRLSYYDRVVFDFDVETSADYDRELVLNSDFQKPAFDDAMRFKEFLKDKYNITSYTITSGGKGLHVIVPFQQTLLFRFPMMLTKYYDEFLYKFKTLDKSVIKDIHARVSRVPFSYNDKTGIRCVAVNYVESFDDYLQKISSSKADFEMEHYVDNDHLVTKMLALDKALLVRDVDRRAEEKRDRIKSFKARAAAGKTNIVDWADLRTLPWDNVKSRDSKSLWCTCPWHSDNKPSLRVYERSAYCQKCGPIKYMDVLSYFGLQLSNNKK